MLAMYRCPQDFPGFSMTEPIDIPSPCIGICQLDPDTRQCLGCMRTAREIARWPQADYYERLKIVGELRRRRRVAGRTSAADSTPRRRARSA